MTVVALSTGGRRFVKYCLTGLLNTGVSYAVYGALIALRIDAAWALAVSYAVGMISSWLVNSRWTFGRSRVDGAALRRFAMVNSGILIVSEMSLHLILRDVTASPYLAQIINLPPVTVVGFMANQLLVFQNAKETARTPATIGAFRRYLAVATGVVIAQRLFVLAAETYAAVSHGMRLTLYSLLVSGLAHWDSGWYIQIARSGYTTVDQTAFWPVYPWLMGGLHALSGLDLRVSGIVISLVCFVFFLSFLGLWAEREFGRRTALWTMALIVFFPTAYYFDAVYTESLFLMLSAAAVYASQTRRFKTANVLVMVAALTRNTGVLLGLILFFDYIKDRQAGWRFWQRRWWRSLGFEALYLLLPAAGLAAYCVWLKERFGHYFPFLIAENHHWHRGYMAPWLTSSNTLHLLFHPQATSLSPDYIRFEMASFAFAVMVLLIGVLYVRKSLGHVGWWLYLFTVVWITASEPSFDVPDYLVSLPRYVLMLFPGFIYFADFLRSNWIRAALTAALAAVLFITSGIFYRGIWIA